jgi:hypothetical protein
VTVPSQTANAAITSSNLNYGWNRIVDTGLASARPATGPTDGAHYWATDTDTLSVWDGSAWRIVREPSQSWTPVVTQAVAVTCTVTRAMYHRFGPVVYASCDLAITGSGTTSNAIAVSLPVTASAAEDVHGQFVIVDNTVAIYAGSIYPSSTTAVTFVSDGQTSLVGVAPAFGLASGDRIRMDVTYRYY